MREKHLQYTLLIVIFSLIVGGVGYVWANWVSGRKGTPTVADKSVTEKTGGKARIGHDDKEEIGSFSPNLNLVLNQLSDIPKDDDLSRWVLYENKEHGYSFRYPGYWGTVDDNKVAYGNWPLVIKIWSGQFQNEEGAEEYLKNHLMLSPTPLHQAKIEGYNVWKQESCDEGGCEINTAAFLNKKVFILIQAYYPGIVPETGTVPENDFLDQTTSQIIETLEPVNTL